jgi:hypothetical protein
MARARFAAVHRKFPTAEMSPLRSKRKGLEWVDSHRWVRAGKLPSASLEAPAPNADVPNGE